MRRYLLDTGPLSALLHNRPGAVALMTDWVTNGEAATSSLVYGEVIEHIMGRPNYPAHRDALRAMLRAVSTPTCRPTACWNATPRSGGNCVRRTGRA